ncbi:nitrilotriacetate monooxygenase component A [Roseomonas sp. TAS13]|nr:nitrilotriacetate monooxygenase component A [Roseomonas sp. TAS13]
MARPERMKLGAFVPGALAGGSAWRQPGFDTAGASSFAAYCHIARLLEAGKFDTLFMNDGVGVRELQPDLLERNAQAQRWDPLTLLPALAVVTERIGLTATANTSYNEPFNLARRLASLDEVSQGRAGWNMVTSLGGGENFNRDDHMLHAERYTRAEEFIEIMTGLWDSWEDDAAIRDKESGRWLDVSRMHLLNHRGPHFAVRGPLNASRPPQGYPVVAQAGASDAGRALAARTGELIFTAAQTIEEGQEFVRDITSRAARYGRSRDSFRIMPGVAVTVASSMVEAEAKYDRLHDIADPRPKLKSISHFASLGVDLSDQPLDGPAWLPDEIPETNTHRSRQKLVVDLIRREKQITLRQLARRLSAGGHRVLIGTPETVADDFQRWFEADAADGFNIMFPSFPESVEDFVHLVVPELQRRGLFRVEYEGRTLREHLGFRRPPNRHSIARMTTD